MKLYRVQANYKNIYVNEMLEAENDKAALETFSKKVDSGDVTEIAGAGFHDPNICFLTFEEVDRNATAKIDIGKTSAGVQVGDSSVGTGESNS